MKKPLGKTEIIGLILLSLLVVAITGCALLLKECGASSSEGPQPVITVLDTIPVPAATTQAKTSKVKKKKSSGTKRGKRQKSKKASENSMRRNPFADTIPTYTDRE